MSDHLRCPGVNDMIRQYVPNYWDRSSFCSELMNFDKFGVDHGIKRDSMIH